MPEETRDIYNRLGPEYLSPKHPTTEFFYSIQEGPLRRLILQAGRRSKTPLHNMDVLNIGPGPAGNSRLMTGGLRDEGSGEELAFDLRKVTFLDISQHMLEHFEHELAQDGMMAGGVFREGDLGKYILGDAEHLTEYIPAESQDIAFAALCDHIPDQPKFYEQVLKTLKPGGAFITTYPAAELNRIIREKIYGISADTTRFVIGGKQYLVPSTILTPEELRAMYEQAGFSNPQTANIMYNGSVVLQPSETIRKAATIIGKPIEEIPVLVSGIGFKR